MGEKAGYTDWYPGQPDDTAGAEDCAVLQPEDQYHWNDVSCVSKNRPLCEKRYALWKFAHAIYIDSFQAHGIEEKQSPEKNDIFNIFAQNIDRVYTLEPPRQGGSNAYPQSIFWDQE